MERIERLVRMHPPDVRQHFAVVVAADGRKVLAWGASRLAREGHDHAEANAIRELASRGYNARELRNLTLVVGRKFNNEFKQSKPCVECCLAIRRAGVFRNVSWSTSSGFEEVRVRDLTCEYISIGRGRTLRARQAASCR
ncbi:hypothetical protein T492DRAFT_848655 [Pavlovales sp. CCMP2436]|nr:hypothetical protein T492DRAFT_848655 [Pavlovales sp. CCMP2436]